MCSFPPPSDSSEDQPRTVPPTTAKMTDSDLRTPLIPKNTTFHQQQPQQLQVLRNPNKTHLQLGVTEIKSIARFSIPVMLMGILLYSRSMISMLFLGRLGDLPLAGGALAIGFANITGYSVLSGLAMGMEPICGQAFGAKRFKLLGRTVQRAVLLLLLTSIPISLLWMNMKKILIFCGQEESIASEAESYILFSVPDLVAQSLLHPTRTYLRAQGVTVPLTWCALAAILLHVPINHLLVNILCLGSRGVAIGAVWTNFNLVLFLVGYIVFSRACKDTWCPISTECLRGWGLLVRLAVPSCVSVCLEWWWYEIMILMCGLLSNPQATVASMGILIQTTAFIYIFPSSLSLGVSTRVGNELGAGRPDKARLATIVALSSSFLLGFSALSFTIAVRNKWAKLFTNDPEIIALTSMVLPVIGLCELGNCPQTTGCGVLRGTARPRVAARINLGCFYGVGTPVAVWLGFYGGFGFRGLWLGLLAAQGACMVSMLFAVARTNWEHEAQKAKLLTSTTSSQDELMCEHLLA